MSLQLEVVIYHFLLRRALLQLLALTQKKDLEVLQFLVEKRNVRAIGHETSDTDPGVLAGTASFPAEAYWLGQDCYQIEMLKNLDQVPEAGAIIIATFPNVYEGSGFPARAFAIVPSEGAEGGKP